MKQGYRVYGANYVKCAECKRVFNLLDETDAEEWYYGHDCEEATE
jgi:hypothetical protein